MKIKSVLVGLFLLIGYFFLVEYWKKNSSDINGDQGQWSSNLISAQKFLYDYSPQHYNCFIGTSLTSRLSKNVPENFFCFGLSGLSVVDGLKLLKHKKNLPDTLLIETNLVSTRTESKEFKKKITSNNVMIELGRLGFMQEKYVPIGVLSNFLYERFNQLYENIKPYYFIATYRLGKIISIKTQSTSPGSNFEKAVLLGQSKALIDTATSLKTFEEVSNLILEFKKKSVVVVFYEMPIDCRKSSSKIYDYNSALCKKEFDPSNYKYIFDYSCEKYSTTDGVHLDDSSAKKASDFILKKLASH
jgi:hypothetical protein